ncbi:heme exporter protein CcmD [Chelativorans salis]|uniref:Heme exporter protein D n=1 Tax=Chelativorans salis TaxID=2978478 RepID=A0ABT2LRP8_9HYPH|nr:heme exporter protein CcmD [Chelativorans sp. EGI FJ00035]MCT7376512.1 heme exporter protein CcmD [Chelativorans sp. EGI FJ00035]
MTHLAYVVAAYAISALAIGGLAVWILLDQRAQKQALKELEERGVRRRSARTEAAR